MKDENRLREFIRNLKIALKGDKAGLWQDWATTEKGDFLKLLTHGGRPFPQAVEQIERAFGISFDTTVRSQKRKPKRLLIGTPMSVVSAMPRLRS